MGRTNDVRNLLISRGNAMTVAEMCVALGYPGTDAKFVASILVSFEKRGVVQAQRGYCSVSNRTAKNYLWSANAQKQNPQGSGFTTQPPQKPRKPRQKAAPPPPPPDPFAAQNAAKADAKRRAAEAARKARDAYFQGQIAADRILKAYAVFARLTGYRGRDADALKAAYRKAALQHHPDRGGSQEIFVELSKAWDAIRKDQ